MTGGIQRVNKPTQEVHVEPGAVQGRTWDEGLLFGAGTKEEPRRCWERPSQITRTMQNPARYSWHSHWMGGKMERQKRGKKKTQRRQLQGGLTGQQYQSHRKGTMVNSEKLWMWQESDHCQLQTKLFNRKILVESKQYMKTAWKKI